MKKVNPRVLEIKESIFSQMTALANEHGAINLSQGFPNFDGPSFIREALREAVNDSKLLQYSPMPGIPILLGEIQNYIKSFYDTHFGLDEITVTNGATEAIMVTSLALLEPGDEVILFEPFYDSYPVAAELSGAKVKVVPLKGPEFRWDSSELELAFSKKTKLVYFNNPQNPTGRVFSKSELEELANLVKKHDAYILSDEVYEFLTFDHYTHIPMMSLEGMRERTLTISSAGKTFGHTGLKVGWVVAPKELSHAVRMVHQFNVFSVNPQAQFATAIGLQNLKNYLPEFRKLYNQKRNLLREILLGAGFKPCVTEGTYFTFVPIPEKAILNGYNDISYCRHLIEDFKVATIPPSAFYLQSKEGEKYLRFCFAKSQELLEESRHLLKDCH